MKKRTQEKNKNLFPFLVKVYILVLELDSNASLRTFSIGSSHPSQDYFQLKILNNCFFELDSMHPL
jgi:hypothetical protein